MTVLHALILGTLQGITEFLPISSSGHLVLAETLLDLRINPDDMLGFNVLLHAGTLAALLLVYARTWIQLLSAPVRGDKTGTRTLLFLAAATVPAAVVGLLFEDRIAMRFQSMLSVGLALAATGLVLLLAECCPARARSIWHRMLHPREKRAAPLTVRTALFVGLAQALALIPGLSRSGLTIGAGRMIGLERKNALDFSFLMAVPIIAGATLLSLIDLFSGTLTLPPGNIIATATAVSFVTSWGAILFLRRFVVTRSLVWFTPYLFAVSAIALSLSVL